MTIMRLQPRRSFHRLAAYTLVELMVSLSIFSFCATAISSLMFATYNTNTSVRNSVTSQTQAEIAFRRMVENLRSATDVLYDPTTGLLIQTPADSHNLSYIYIYYLSNGQLREKIETAGSLTLIQDSAIVDNVGGFTVSRVGTTLPQVWSVTLTINAGTKAPPVVRSATVTGRNLNT